MADTLDYFRHAKRPDPNEQVGPKGPKAAIPLDFEIVAARTKDQGAASAIEAQLRRENIPAFRTHDGPAVDQTIQLLVRAADRERAGVIAHSILSRREKLRSQGRG